MSEIDGIRERVALDWQTYSSPTIPEMDRRTLLAAYDALAAENAALRSQLETALGQARYLIRDQEAKQARLAEAEDKALRFDLDQLGIALREKEAVELVELRQRVAEAQEEADRRTREVEACYTVQRDLKARLAQELDGIKALEAVIVSRGERLAEAERDAAIGRLVRLKLASGNSVPVERCVIFAHEIPADSATHREDDSHD